MLPVACEAENARTVVAHTAAALTGLSGTGDHGLPAVTAAGGRHWRGLGGTGGVAGQPHSVEFPHCPTWRDCVGAGRSPSRCGLRADPVDLDDSGGFQAYRWPVPGCAVAGH